ncbi:MAG: dihydrolipoyl dehydrogenase [Bacteroidia bacterium]|nr:dihydrolipoyl dehydrogenase [Bacteroidia bacterium]
MNSYDVAVIGSGPGGYIAAIRCAQLGMKTAIIERYPSLGGTCLNVGCIPSKALLDTSEHFYNAGHSFAQHGILLDNLRPDFGQMIARKAKVVKDNCDGVAYLMKKNKIDVYTGHGSFENANTLLITKDDGSSDKISAKKVIIATGSKPSTLPGLEIDKKRIITSTEALELKEIPKHLVLIGGGVIGIELGSVYARLGSKVSVVEYADSIIGSMDRELGKELQKICKKLGFEFYLKHKVTGAENTGEGVVVKAENMANNETVSIEGDYCLVAVGRRPYTDKLGLENAGLQTDERGRIPVNAHKETKVPGIFAIGDVIEGVMLAHKAEEEGVYVAEYLNGQKPHINPLLIPGIVYTWPEVAAAGYTEEQLKEKGTAYKSGKFPFIASGRARASMDTDGFVKVLADAATDEVLGVHIIGARAADLIMEAVVAMEFRASAEDIGRICHGHPTFSEALKDAALNASDKRALNM